MADRTIDTEITELNYGWFNLTPKWLQKLNCAAWYLVFVGLANTLFSGTVNGLSGAVQSSVETRFGLSSTASSWIIIVYEIGTIPTLLVITYIGSKGVHRPRWVAAAMSGCAISIFLYSLPHFLTDTYMPTGGGDDGGLCQNRTGEDADCEEEKSPSSYLSVFIVARLVMGASGVPLALFSMTFLDDCLPAGKFTLYSAIFAAGGVLGPALGFVVGGLSLDLFTDWYKVEDDQLTIAPGDPRWVGAWWVGFCGASLLLLMAVLPLSGFPCDLPGSAAIRAHKKSEAFKGDIDEQPLDPTQIDFGIADIPRYMKDIFTNWSFVCIAVYICCDMAIVSAFSAFGPKYVEVQFSMTPAQSGLLFGAMVVPAGVIGTISAGLLVQKLNLSAKQMMKMEAIIGCIVVAMGTTLLVKCDQADYAGINVGYNGSVAGDLIVPCNAACDCDDVLFHPICSTYQVQYFSPCHAGCLNISQDTNEYHNCSCIGYHGDDTSATNEMCSSPDCELVPVFAVMLFFAMTGLFMAEAMNISLVIRIVPNTHRLFAMMIQSILLRLIGTIPGPLLFGAAFDASCLLWQDTCGDRGSCLHYDTSQLSWLFLAICESLKIVSVLSMFLAWFLYKPPGNKIGDEVSSSKENAVSPSKENAVSIPKENAVSIPNHNAVSPSMESEVSQSNNDVISSNKELDKDYRGSTNLAYSTDKEQSNNGSRELNKEAIATVYNDITQEPNDAQNDIFTQL